MSRTDRLDDGEVTVGSDHVVVRRPHEQRSLTARILHRRSDPSGSDTWLVLDRRVHHPGTATLGAWRVSGAVTTELRRASQA